MKHAIHRGKGKGAPPNRHQYSQGGWGHGKNKNPNYRGKHYDPYYHVKKQAWKEANAGPNYAHPSPAQAKDGKPPLPPK